MIQSADIKVIFQQDKSENPTQKIRIFFKDIFNNDIQIDLRPGEFVYSQTSYISNSLRIYSRKGLITIKEEKKPEFLSYYVGYGYNEYLHKFDKKEELSNVQTQVLTSLEKEETILDKALKKVKDYSEKKKPSAKSKSKKGPGRPKKRGPKKGTRRQIKK